ncbi:hypothetical protein COCVIDRAFT_34486 [Bipolaris victoriae FI3]|uniref:Rhodopsin domain-containing protein n=1 Tax=Bipolaris victoriae (strain FI3) TaxID=930091 RepID=W7EJQ9_BIPV3|nr:hypothetical protein COCVIDRAFT_34486 [Bipolaris victoriae FI3]
MGHDRGRRFIGRYQAFSRVKLVHVVGWDDLFILLSLISSIVASSFVHYGVVLGFGQHTAVVVAQSGNDRLFKSAMIQILGYPVFSLPNISITILVCQILSSSPRQTIALYSMSILQFCAYTPFTDVVLAVVPACTFWNLQMAWSTKIGLIAMMSMAMLSAIVTIVKGTYLPLFMGTTDPLWKPVPLVIWDLVEQNIVITAACIPTMRPFFSRTWRCGFSTKTGARSTSLAQDPSTYTKRTRNQLKCRTGSISDVALTQFESYRDRFD